jgi:hypothetical protein
VPQVHRQHITSPRAPFLGEAGKYIKQKFFRDGIRSWWTRGKYNSFTAIGIREQKFSTYAESMHIA